MPGFVIACPIIRSMLSGAASPVSVLLGHWMSMRLGSEPIRHPPSAVSHYLAAPTASNALRAELCGSGEMTQRESQSQATIPGPCRRRGTGSTGPWAVGARGRDCAVKPNPYRRRML